MGIDNAERCLGGGNFSIVNTQPTIARTYNGQSLNQRILIVCVGGYRTLQLGGLDRLRTYKHQPMCVTASAGVDY